ncbi:hydantoinase B/oxoprolinase family protein [Amycolatopsis jejuensis]|uniref:hydantoinase B/oxoprolinase family protein n=1 Tax=Amycolatopsis jejuensis TaxID=330084 RepID=UPI0005277585|nr:hydantoinase B/oxoprolinase family protein [Amycolatopsis jejuensis]
MGVPSIELEILRTTLAACPEELGAVLANTAPTAQISQDREYAVAIADPAGAVVATDNPLQLASMARTISRVAGYFEFDVGDGDVVLTNDPYAGGTQLTDITLVTPLMADDRLVAFVAVRVRVGDVGGQVGGNLNPDATELLAEGHPYPPVKIRRGGKPVRDMRYAFLLNGRRMTETRRTLDAATATLELGLRRLRELIGRHGAETVRAALGYALDYSEQLTSKAIQGWTRGTYEGTRVLDLGEPVTVRLTATVADGHVVLDFSGSGDQLPLFVNSSAGTTASRAVGAVFALLTGEIPATSGVLRAVRVLTRPGSVVHPIAPAPVGWGGAHCGNEVTEVVAATLRQAGAGPAPALTVPQPLVLSRPAADRSDQLDLGRWGIGGAGAVAGRDGWGPPQLATRGQLHSVEHWESEHDMRIERMEFVVDSAGAGRWRGASAVEAALQLAPDRRYTLWTGTIGDSVAGQQGGGAGEPGAIAFHTIEGWQPAPLTATETAIDADRVLLRLAGGGGFGDPAERDREAVIDDLADGLISEQAAHEVYGLTAADLGGRDD